MFYSFEVTPLISVLHGTTANYPPQKRFFKEQNAGSSAQIQGVSLTKKRHLSKQTSMPYTQNICLLIVSPIS